MPSRSLLSKFLTHGTALAVGIAIGWLGLPLWRMAVMARHQQPYGLLVEHCDDAMRTHYQTKQAASILPTETQRHSLKEAEIGLVVCQDYDLYQKQLLQWGLREEELGQMRLRAIEARASDLEEVVATHEIKF
ncbi:TIGR03982 family His-Xaa-Ser system protein [Blastomonas fulva]|uniref:TIGR03982 family His-Xaa-Ser system protein n=1 Tax=Blastomonas fulva TaxID=1550728 RepID=UPI003F702FC6